jgi:hypothetical protein
VTGPDNGCEGPAQPQSCQACAASCPTDFSCQQVGGYGSCGCTKDSNCGVLVTGTCDSNAGVCVCGNEYCNWGETCGGTISPPVDGGVEFAPSAGITSCACNGGPGCGLSLTGTNACCPLVGCVDLDANPAHCGGCGHACPPNFTCFNGTCRCASTAACTAPGGNGTCNLGTGACICEATAPAPCPNPGQRCQPGGVCG